MTKRPTRNSQGQFGGFIYILHKPPSDLPDAAKKKYETKLNDLFGRAYDLQHLLESTKVETVGGDCPTYAATCSLLPLGNLPKATARRWSWKDTSVVVRIVRSGTRNILVTEQEWGELRREAVERWGTLPYLCFSYFKGE